MSSYVMLFCFLATSLVSIDAATLSNKVLEVEVRADSKQLLRSEPIEFEPIKEEEQPEPKAAEPAAPAPKEHDAAEVARDSNGLDISRNIEVYYETRCPDCIDFINNTLAGLWRDVELRGHFNITMNSYGNTESVPISKVSEGYRFFHPDTTNTTFRGKDGKAWQYVHLCQHGSDECLSNLVQACAFEQVNQSQHMELVLCMATQPNWGAEKISYECMTKAGIDHDKVKECVQSPHGNELMAELGKKTGKVEGRQGTPWVMLGGKNVADVTTLFKSACQTLANVPTLPKSCDGYMNNDDPAADSNQEGSVPDFVVLPVIKAEVNKELFESAPKTLQQV